MGTHDLWAPWSSRRAMAAPAPSNRPTAVASGPAPAAHGPSCSVVVPVKDDARHLRHLLADLAAQTQAPAEVIVVDNGSRDDSAEVALRAGCRVIVESAPGIPAAAAAGYNAAHGDLILRCDADSRLPQGWIAAHQRAHSTGGRSVALVTGPAVFLLPRHWGTVAAIAYLGAYMLCTGAALGHLPAFGSTMSMRRVWWERVRGEVSSDPGVHDDMDLSFRVAPEEDVLLDWRAWVGMSPRALLPGHLATLRGKRALSTLRRNWIRQRPWERWAERLHLDRAAGGGAARRSIDRQAVLAERTSIVDQAMDVR